MRYDDGGTNGGFSCGTTMEVESIDGKWIATRLEISGHQWYLIGLPEIHDNAEFDGLSARL